MQNIQLAPLPKNTSNIVKVNINRKSNPCYTTTDYALVMVK